MPNILDRVLAMLATKKQTERSDAVESAVSARKQARLELDKAIEELAQARSRKHSNGTS